ncbi:MAG: sigma-70 family RNA polymerase sigma factor [Verrucomicrobia bacterium]|nr:sigma-70 family RNA polymerase sigma factor [Verrucomicrobiota bacterium]
MEDFELLESWATRRTEGAFHTLTDRYVNLVHSAAVRQIGNADTAKDVTQAVFLTLAAKAGTISRQTILAGWLLRTTRFAAANARRLEQRRHHYEQQAMQSFAESAGLNTTWQRIAPLLDEALDHLPDRDRDAVVLRFFEQLPLKRVAEKLGLSEDAAQKRVSRALEKLRVFLTRRGQAVSVGALTSAVAANSVQAAPADVSAAISATVASTGAATGSFATTVARATLRAIRQVKMRLFAIRAASVVILAGLSVAIVLQRDATTVPANEIASVAPTSVITSQPTQEVTAVAATPIASAPDTVEIRLSVVDSQTAVPVANARLSLVSSGEFTRQTTNEFATDANGLARVTYSPIAAKWWSHRVEIFCNGYVPKYVSWSDHQQDRVDEIPNEYTVKLDSAVTIGGFVLDQQDAPISGARVVFSVSGPVASLARERLTMMGDYHTEITGADGRWTCNHVPANFGKIDFKPVHPLFQAKRWVTDSPDMAAYLNVERIPEADFLAGRALMRLKPGLVIAGTVTDESGQPVAGARVTQNYDFHDSERSLVTSAEGSFQFRNGRSGTLSLTIQADNLAPVVTSMVLNASVDNLHVVLPAGQELLGRVVDETDQPIADASIEPASPSSDSRTFFQWHVKADANGRFAWNAAPAVQEYAVSASGFESLRRVKLTADGSEQMIRLTRKLRLASVNVLGEVVDAATKRPPSGVRVQVLETQREANGKGFHSFTTVPEDAPADGKFRLKTSSGTVSFVLEISAAGYWPQRFTNQVTSERALPLHVELVEAPIAAGVVLTPAGESAAGATLVVCGHDEFAQMSLPAKLVTDSRGSGAVTAIADAQGRFRLPTKLAPEVVVITHARGFCEMPFSQVNSNTIVRLQPWGRIEGTARAGAKPLARETIRLSTMSGRMNLSSRVSVFLDTTTDAEGRFVFSTVPAGEWEVMREINKLPEGRAGIRFPAYSHGVLLAVRIGETVTVTLGGEGRAIIGRAVAPESIADDVWTENFVTLTLKLSTPNAVEPLKFEALPSDGVFSTAAIGFIESSPANEDADAVLAGRRLRREYRAMFSADGGFRIEDVPSGEYMLKISLVRMPKLADGNPLNFVPIAAFELDVTVPASASSSENVPVNLGVLRLSPPTRLRLD